MNRDEVKAWVQGRVEAEKRSLRELEFASVDPEDSALRADELVRLWETLHPWPGPKDPVREAGAEAVRALWSQLSARRPWR